MVLLTDLKNPVLLDFFEDLKVGLEVNLHKPLQKQYLSLKKNETKEKGKKQISKYNPLLIYYKIE